MNPKRRKRDVYAGSIPWLHNLYKFLLCSSVPYSQVGSGLKLSSQALIHYFFQVRWELIAACKETTEKR